MVGNALAAPFLGSAKEPLPQITLQQDSAREVQFCLSAGLSEALLSASSSTLLESLLAADLTAFLARAVLLANRGDLFRALRALLSFFSRAALSGDAPALLGRAVWGIRVGRDVRGSVLMLGTADRMEGSSVGLAVRKGVATDATAMAAVVAGCTVVATALTGTAPGWTGETSLKLPAAVSGCGTVSDFASQPLTVASSESSACKGRAGSPTPRISTVPSAAAAASLVRAIRCVPRTPIRC